MSIYDIPGIVAIAYPIAATPLNIQAGFRVAGVQPYDRDVFLETEFAPSYVTDRPIQNPALPGPRTNSALLSMPSYAYPYPAMLLLTAGHQLQKTSSHIQKLAPENQPAKEENDAYQQFLLTRQ
ncbi:hypothetical protein ABG768_017661 [Culter alburnus]|uniref:Uncharacterized protein n=1 Tax=Culter alburnus TaxID=194366 RepID=A0AAW1Z0B9_CULAL